MIQVSMGGFKVTRKYFDQISYVLELNSTQSAENVYNEDRGYFDW